jgi:hypothetical protein
MYTNLFVDVNPAQMVVVKTASNLQIYAPWRKTLIWWNRRERSDFHALAWKHLLPALLSVG